LADVGRLPDLADVDRLPDLADVDRLPDLADVDRLPDLADVDPLPDFAVDPFVDFAEPRVSPAFDFDREPLALPVVFDPPPLALPVVLDPPPLAFAVVFGRPLAGRVFPALPPDWLGAPPFAELDLALVERELPAVEADWRLLVLDRASADVERPPEAFDCVPSESADRRADAFRRLVVVCAISVR
jgi:hypothetical protein